MLVKTNDHAEDDAPGNLMQLRLAAQIPNSAPAQPVRREVRMSWQRTTVSSKRVELVILGVMFQVISWRARVV